MPELYNAKAVRYPNFLSALANYFGVPIEDVEKPGSAKDAMFGTENAGKSLLFVSEGFPQDRWIFSRKDGVTGEITLHYFVASGSLPTMVCKDFAKVLEGAFPYVPNNEYVSRIAERAYELTQEALCPS